jgi:hypothetical protein
MHARYVSLAALLTLHLAHAPTLSACAPAPREGETVAIADEEALIVHDPAAGVEHFIRRAAFRTAAREFGFLVPTPAVPTLTEAPAWLFERITAHIAPRVEHRTRYVGVTVASCCLAPFLLTARTERSSIAASAAPPVELLSTQRVAGYDAAVLRASDADALSRWLADHGYANSPELRDWLAPYVSQRWIVTAFRVAKADVDDPLAGTANVRMTFATPRAVYPYREPASQRVAVGPRRLRVHVLAPQRVQGTVGESGPRFPGAVTWSRPEENWGDLLGDALPAAATRGRLWLTSFDDTSAPRPGTDDVWFQPDRAQSEVIPEPVIRWRDERVPVPVDLLAVVGVGGWWWSRRRRRAAGVRSTPAP